MKIASNTKFKICLTRLLNQTGNLEWLLCPPSEQNKEGHFMSSFGRAKESQVQGGARRDLEDHLKGGESLCWAALLIEGCVDSVDSLFQCKENYARADTLAFFY